MRRQLWLEIDEVTQRELIEAARDTAPVSGLTHGYYKYPARFSPTFVRNVINALSAPGDLCMDPHVGGGTTLVEAIALGRNAVGVDISALAAFISTVKTTVYSKSDLEELAAWGKRLSKVIDAQKPSKRFTDYENLGYYKHLGHASRWRLRKAIEQALGSAVRLRSKRLEQFGRCAILRTAQWALDGRKQLPTTDEFRAILVKNVQDMLRGAEQLKDAVHEYDRSPFVRIVNRSASGIESDKRLLSLPPPKLVVTSPPYPGVHVLYHRWQVDGRKETPLPFMIAGKLDGAGSSFYTMGDRKHPELKSYFDNIRQTISSVVSIADDETIIVQMVAFSDQSWQLNRYLETMAAVGLSEVFLPVLKGKGDGRLWRKVPNRRWYSDQQGETPGSHEVVLIHRKATRIGKQSRRSARPLSEASSAKSSIAAR